MKVDIHQKNNFVNNGVICLSPTSLIWNQNEAENYSWSTHIRNMELK